MLSCYQKPSKTFLTRFFFIFSIVGKWPERTKIILSEIFLLLTFIERVIVNVDVDVAAVCEINMSIHMQW